MMPALILLDGKLRTIVVMALVLGQRELRRNGTCPPSEFNELVAMLADTTGPERTELDACEELPEPELVGYEEAGRRMGLSARTVRRMVTRGELPAVRAGRRVLLRTTDLREFGVIRDVG